MSVMLPAGARNAARQRGVSACIAGSYWSHNGCVLSRQALAAKQQQTARGAQKMRHVAPSTSSLLGLLLKVELYTVRTQDRRAFEWSCCI